MTLLPLVAGAAPGLMRLVSDPALTPNGATVVFAWRGDLWSVAVDGGTARQLTRDPAEDGQPAYSPDGTELAFVSDRSGSKQVWVMPAEGGMPERLTVHTEGYALEGWLPDGKSLLVSIQRDHFWRRPERFSLLARSGPTPESVLFDDYGADGEISPEGRRLLFTREGERWWRKGYRGSRASQVWIYDLSDQSFRKLLDHPEGSCWPLWKPDGTGFYYVGARDGTFNLRERNLETGTERQWTHFQDDGVLFPSISRDGSTIVFRHLFDLYVLRPGKDQAPRRIEIRFPADGAWPVEERLVLEKASEATFSGDGLEVAFVAGGDLWVMDTELREPRQVTDTPEEESSPVFAPDGTAILFVSDRGGQSDLWRAERGNTNLYWWQNEEFKLERLTDDSETEGDLRWSPAGKRLAFVKGRGDLWTMDSDGKNARCLLESWDRPEYDWSPDGRWIVYAVSDTDFNRDIWVVAVEGQNKPFNLSRHPDNDGAPVWSSDGRLIAFTGRRIDTEVDIYFVWLRREEDEKDKRQRTLEKALEKMNKGRAGKPAAGAGEPDKPAAQAGDEAKANESKQEEAAPKQEKKIPEVIIDFEDIHERIRRVSIPNASPSGLFWSHDSKKLAFAASIDGKNGTYTIEIPDELKPKLLSEKTGSQARWISKGNQILWLSEGVPGTLSAEGKATSYNFNARQVENLPGKFRAAFDLCWRTMRDHYYDGNLGNRDWPAVRRKYIDMAEQAPDGRSLADVVDMMLGELNGSHLGFSFRRADEPPRPPHWNEATVHLGVRFDPGFPGPGLKVRDVLPTGPADRKESRIEPGEIVLAIDGGEVSPETDLAPLLTGTPDRDVVLRVKKEAGKRPKRRKVEEQIREVVLRPISYAQARSLLYEKWIRDNRALVDKASRGQLGYLHIQGMNMPSFHRFERELYAVGFGKSGLVIDVRENGGGFTTDHLLTALTQPRHAITVPRGGGPGYPQDRKVYATWDKPIVVLCNQNSFSNAEIFSHAIKTLGRGQLVGVPTAGGVISTGGRVIMDLGFLRLPYRGWHLLGSGQDMELHGAVPDHILWPEPGQLPAGRDVQLRKAVQVLLKEVRQAERRPMPDLINASER